MERRKERGRKKAQAHSSLLRTFCPPDKLLRKFPPKHTRGRAGGLTAQPFSPPSRSLIHLEKSSRRENRVGEAHRGGPIIPSQIENKIPF